MSLNKQPDLKKVILELPEAEKDKLLIRLIGKDSLLMSRLRFTLMEDEYDLEDRRNILKKEITTLFNDLESYRGKSFSFIFKSIRWNLLAALYKSNEHANITKDKTGDFEARLLIFSIIIDKYNLLFKDNMKVIPEAVAKYIARQIKFTYTRYLKLHEDLQFDYKDEFQSIIGFFYKTTISEKLKELEVSQKL